MTLERLDVNECADRFAATLHRNIYDFVLIRLTPGQRVLEVGTGLGAFTEELLPKCGTYTGVEFDPEACVEARRKTHGKADIIQADARKLPFDDGQFSFIVCLEVLEHLGDWQAGVRNIHRCLLPEGIAIITVPYRRIGGKSKTNEFHVYEPGKGELVSLFQKLFTKIEVYYQYFEETWAMTLARKLHVRRFFGFNRNYADLSAGLPHAISQLHIRRQANGLKLGLMIVASGRK
jgi:SAM-dependent methyltransferase